MNSYEIKDEPQKKRIDSKRLDDLAYNYPLTEEKKKQFSGGNKEFIYLYIYRQNVNHLMELMLRGLIKNG